MNNYYHLLGIQEDASSDQINEAYKKLAHKFHPDKNNNDPFFDTLFEQITTAKQLLSDKEKKPEYDLNLLNYSDAYDLFRQQRLEDEFQRQQKRELREQQARKRKRVFIFGALTFIACVLIVLWVVKDSNHVETSSSGKFQSIQEVVKTSVPIAKANNLEKVDEVPGDNESLVKIVPEEKVFEKKMIIDKPTLKTKSQPSFTKSELQNILAKIRTAKLINSYNTNCITIKKTRKSDVDTDFKVASYLQEKGFIITGREIVSGDFKGIDIGFNGVCLILLIGEK